LEGGGKGYRRVNVVGSRGHGGNELAKGKRGEGDRTFPSHVTHTFPPVISAVSDDQIHC